MNNPYARRVNNDNKENYIYSVLLSFLPVGIIFSLYFLINALLNSNEYVMGSFLYTLIMLALFLGSNFISYLSISSIMDFKIYWRSSLLTNGFLIGFMLTNQTSAETLIPYGYYLMSLSFFHLSEFVFTALFNTKEVTTDSFLLNHSIEYGVAALASWVEFFIEAFLFPSLKKSLYTRFIGLFLVLFGEAFRKLAMYTAGTNFNHYVQEARQQDHVLVTKGVYRLIRHPSYFGWFYWSIGTQILLANPICTVLYAITTWKFFKSRIMFEEFYLLKFFGKQYSNYQKKTPSGIPFVKGYTLVEENLD